MTYVTTNQLLPYMWLTCTQMVTLPCTNPAAHGRELNSVCAPCTDRANPWVDSDKANWERVHSLRCS